MAVVLPNLPGAQQAEPRLVSRVRNLEPTFGGPTSRVQRFGSRWALDVKMPPMDYVEAMAWIAALVDAEGDTVVFDFPQPDFAVGTPGAPLVNGANQQGRLLNLDGFSGSYTAKAGQFFNVTIGGRLFLYQVAADKTAAAGALAALRISPMIRRSPPDNAVVSFDPKIEGFLNAGETSWSIDVARNVGLSFTITERE